MDYHDRFWIVDGDDESLYAFGSAGLVEFYLYRNLNNMLATLGYNVMISELWDEAEDLGERLIGEARDNYDEL